MNGSTYKRCGCRDATTRNRLGQDCPKLRRARGDWNPHHGVWQLQIELPPTRDGRRRPMRRGGAYAGQADADLHLTQIRDALAVVEATDTDDLIRVGDLIEAAVKADQPIPTPTEIRRLLHLDAVTDTALTVGPYLDSWFAGRKTIKASTKRTYASHIRLYLRPHLGIVRLDKLRVGHLDTMFEAIEERNDTIAAARASRDPKIRATVKGMRRVGATTMHRIRATLRVALNHAISQRLTDFNPAAHVELPTAKRPKAQVWTDERVTVWQQTGKVPSPVMVWTPAHTGAFLDHIHEDRLYALYHLVAFRGLRRGEACGLHWTDLDLDGGTLTVRWQIVQLGWATHMDTPKSDGSEATIALDDNTVTALREHRTRQRRERLAAGPAWTETGLVFVTRTGAALHPADVTDHFHYLTDQAGLPPIRLHDLRHGAATLALAAGVEMKLVQEMLRHSSITITSDTYTSVLPEIARAAAEKTAAIVPRRTRPKSKTSFNDVAS